MPRPSHKASTPTASFFAAYVGPSMNPTLREPELMEIRPYAGSPIRAGDVALFLPPEADRPIVHRIIRLTPAGITTRGDNCTRNDGLLQPEFITGRVVAAWRGSKRRPIAGGFRGRFLRRRLGWLRHLDRGVTPLLRPLYRSLARIGGFARWLPAAWRPRAVVFRSRVRDQYRLVLGRRIIGQFDDQTRRWRIQRPFRWLVDERGLPGWTEKSPAPRSREPGPPSPHPLPLRPRDRYDLALADGSRWEIAAENEEAESIVARLGQVMRLGAAHETIVPFAPDDPFRLSVRVDAQTSEADCYVPLASAKGRTVRCVLSPCEHWGGPSVNLVRLSLILAREAQARGGFLLHGALAERDGAGVIMAAPGGTGKTTASGRLPPPWRSLSDDATLVVRDRKGGFWAHPWPTWSRFLEGGPGGSWDVATAVPVDGIFLLVQAASDRVEAVGPGRAVSLLGEFIEQVSAFMSPGLSPDALRTLRLERLANLCALTKAVPVHWLHLSLTGRFWQEIDRTLADRRRRARCGVGGETDSISEPIVATEPR